MPRGKISKPVVEQLLPRETDYVLWDEQLPGFGIKVTPRGTRIYLVQYRPKGASRIRRYTIGQHGRPWAPGQAREKAQQLLALVRLGQDPFQLDRERREQDALAEAASVAAKAAAIRAADTRFELLVDAFIEQHCKRRNRRWDEAQRILSSADVHALRGKSVANISKKDAFEAVATATRRAPGAGRLLYAHLRTMLSWCQEQGHLDANPLIGTRAPPSPPARDRWLRDDELREVIKGSRELGVPFGPLIQLLVITAQRREEISGLRWSELNFDRREWLLPGERTKNKREHMIDLSPQAIEVLEQLPRKSDFVFSTTGSTSVSGHSRAKGRLDRIIAERLQAHDLPPMPPWHIHDLRRTAATGMSRLGFAPHVVEAVLNHRSGTRGGLVAVYQHYEHREERRAALMRWGEHVAQIQKGD